LSGALELRGALAEDVPALLSLLAQLDQYHAEIQPSFFRSGARSGREVREIIAGRYSTILVAEGDGGELLGAVTLRVYDTPTHPLMVPERRALLEDMVVASGARRLGVGQALASAARAWCREQGATQLLLTVWEGNEGAASFYREAGFSPVSQVLGCTLDEG
jgi:GNAT superfamily N-acetyltransferase